LRWPLARRRQRRGLLQATVEPERIADHGYMDYALAVLGRLP
jgi:hypothetical protein